jgi:primosomal protein N''
MNTPIDPQSNEAILARHRDYFRTVHPDVKAAAMREAEAKRTALQTAIGHLQAVLNKCRTADEQLRADTAAREWLTSIGSEPT